MLIYPKMWGYLCNYCVGLWSMTGHKYKKAIKYFNKCLNSNLQNEKIPRAFVYEQLGKCYFDINEIGKGKTFLLKSLELSSSNDIVNSEIASRLGFIFYNEGDFEKAKYYLQKAIDNFKKIDYTNIEAVKEHLNKIKK